MPARVEADAEVADSLYKRAKGFSKKATKIFLPRGATTAEEVVYAPYMEYYAPDVGAQKHWLTVRRRNSGGMEWGDKREVEHKGLPDLGSMDDAEARIRWATQLVERVQRLLAQPVIIDNEPEEE
jgi:hypothetical protein